jgi:hypothetical protein
MGNVVLGFWLLSGIGLKVAAGLAVVWTGTIVIGSFVVGKWRIAARDLAITLGLLGLLLAL